MSASVKISEEKCFWGCNSERTYEVKLKKPIIHTVVCDKHLYEILKREQTNATGKTNNEASEK